MDAEEQNQDEVLDFDGQDDVYDDDYQEEEGYGHDGDGYEGEEQNGDMAPYEAMVGDAEHKEQGADVPDDADDQILEGLEGVDEEASARQPMGEGNKDVTQDEHQGEGGKKIIDLTRTSNRLERLQHRSQPQPAATQQAPGRPQQAPGRPAQQQPPQQQQQRRSGTGIKRYFMLKCVNVVNWETARKYGCWATQPQNEEKFDKAFKDGHTVVFFLSINQSGGIQGYGRMLSTTTDGPDHVPWQDIKDQVANFRVAWDCAATLPFDKVYNLTNPFAGNMPLNRHKDGVELAPRCGEPLLAAMNRNAVELGTPAAGPLASWGLQRAPAQRGTGPAVAGGMQHRMVQPGVMGRGGPQGRGMRGMAGGRGMMAGRMPAGRGMVQPPPPPRPGGSGLRPGQQQQPPPGLARFVGRLEGLPGLGQQPLQQQQQHLPPRGASPPPRSHYSGSDAYRDGYRQERRRSRSRSRSPVSRGTRGDSRGRSDAVGRQDKTADNQAQLDSQGSESITYEMYLAAYDKVQQRLKTINSIVQKDKDQPQMQQQQTHVQQQPHPQQRNPAGSSVADDVGACQIVPLEDGSHPQDVVNGAAARAEMAGFGMQQQQQLVQPGGAAYPGGVGSNNVTAGMMMGRGGGPRIMQGAGASNPGVGRGAVQAQSEFPTLEEYIMRIRASYLQKRGQPCPYTDEQIAVKYHERLAQLGGGGGAAQASRGAASAGSAAATGRMGAGPVVGQPNPPAPAAAVRQSTVAAGQQPVPDVADAAVGNGSGMPKSVASGPMVSNPMQAAATAAGMNPAMMNPMMAMNPMMMNPMAAMAMMGAGAMGMGMNPMAGMGMGMGAATPAAMGMNPMMMQNVRPQGQMGGRGGRGMGGRGQQKRKWY